MTDRIVLDPAPYHVTVHVFGTLVAETEDALRLDEEGLPAVYYLPRSDVDERYLEASSHNSHCPFKGDASYWTLVIGEVRFEDAVWSYETPLPAVASIAGRMAFWEKKIGPALEILVTPATR